MLRSTDTRDTRAVAARIHQDYLEMFPDGDPGFVHRAFGWAVDCFEGRHAGYQANDARYHDLEHTLQGALCLSGLLRGRHEAGTQPPLDRLHLELTLVAILFHDTGYLKRTGDTSGTGAKYTSIHVQRSCEFAAEFLGLKGYPTSSIASVQNMIRCTGLGANTATIPFGDDLERVCGYALGTADLLGQMAAADYVDKLPGLYEEFVEAGRFRGKPGAEGFASREDLLNKTPAFWERYVLPKIEGDFLGLYRFLARPWPHGPNEYVECAEANVRRIRALTGAPAPRGS